MLLSLLFCQCLMCSHIYTHKQVGKASRNSTCSSLSNFLIEHLNKSLTWHYHLLLGSKARAVFLERSSWSAGNPKHRMQHW